MERVEELFSDLTTNVLSTDGFYITVNLTRNLVHDAGMQTALHNSGRYREDNEIMVQELQEQTESVSGNQHRGREQQSE